MTSSTTVILIVGTKVIADPETCYQELSSNMFLGLLRDRPCPQAILTLISSYFLGSLFMHDKLLESV